MIAINLNFLFQYLRCFKNIIFMCSSLWTLHRAYEPTTHTSQWCLQVKKKFKATELRQDNSLISVNAGLNSVLSQCRIRTKEEQGITECIILHSHCSLQTTVLKYHLVLTAVFKIVFLNRIVLKANRYFQSHLNKFQYSEEITTTLRKEAIKAKRQCCHVAANLDWLLKGNIGLS